MRTTIKRLYVLLIIFLCALLIKNTISFMPQVHAAETVAAIYAVPLKPDVPAIFYIRGEKAPGTAACLIKFIAQLKVKHGVRVHSVLDPLKRHAVQTILRVPAVEARIAILQVRGLVRVVAVHHAPDRPARQGHFSIQLFKLFKEWA